MKSPKYEEIQKRRAKASTSRSSQYQKMVLVAGVLTLFLAIWISPRLAPFLAIGVVGGMVVLFLIFKPPKARREAEAKAEPQQALPAEEESGESQQILPMTEGEIIDDSPDLISEQINFENLQESMPLESVQVFAPPQPLPVEKEKLSPVQEFSRDEVLAQIQERLALLEEKVSRLEDRVMDLEEKAASYHGGELKPEPQIDLQTIISHLDEKEGNVAWPSIKS